jgi:hypothetical protein
MKKNVRKETIIGLACLAVSLTTTQVYAIPTFMSGALMACSLLLTFLGFLPEKTYVSLKNWKARLFRHTKV